VQVARADGEALRRDQWSWHTRLWLAAVGWLIALVIRLVYLTLRVKLVDEHGIFAARAAGGGPIIVVFWHETLTLIPLLSRRWSGHVTALLSQHRDAEIAAQALGRLGIDTVRGSSTRGWAGALRGLLAARARGEDLAIVPDGPRGPRREVKDGVVQLARATGLPVVPFGAAAWPARRLGSWDRMMVPRPFARVVLVSGAPVTVPRDADARAQAAALAAVQRSLEDLTRRAEAVVGAPPAPEGASGS
jgi:lysophospholipid acyltransferase (LPLAT)-like uncharacterized protein